MLQTPSEQHGARLADINLYNIDVRVSDSRDTASGMRPARNRPDPIWLERGALVNYGMALHPALVIRESQQQTIKTQLFVY